MPIISSICYSDDEVLSAFKSLYLNGQNFNLDPTYSKGNFYKNISRPDLTFDLNPQDELTSQADCKNLPIQSNSINSIIFDPPFMFGTHGQTKNNIMNKRFTMFDSFEELMGMYTGALLEFSRILNKGGYLFFKCQDYTDSKTTMTHCLVYNWAIQTGFYAKDIFILLSKNRIFNPTLTQRHARKFHSYWWVFQKIAQFTNLPDNMVYL